MARQADHSRGTGSPRNPQVFSESSDFALVQSYRRGNQDALDALMVRYHQFVRLKASSYFLAGGDAEDLIQEGMLGLYKAVRDYRDDRLASFRSFAIDSPVQTSLPPIMARPSTTSRAWMLFLIAVLRSISLCRYRIRLRQ